MQTAGPSRTARAVAIHRAAHQILDSRRVFDDPLAPQIVALSEAELARENDPSRRPRRLYYSFRSRFAEDGLAAAVGRGTRQYVVLGAGLDTFAYRNPFAGLRVFEVDRPQTQAWKRECLSRAGIAVPASVTFVPIDFERATLSGALNRAGFRVGEPAFFSWLGVVPYLTREAIIETLGFVASLSGEVVFDYAVPPDTMAPELRAGHEALAKRVADSGEPWVSYFDPPALVDELRALGFDEIDDLGPSEIAVRYFGAPTGTRLGAGGHVVRARCSIGGRRALQE